MPPPLDRETLKSMKRADLQRICKDYGIKANLKTEALIDLLVVTTQDVSRPTPPLPQRAPSTRIASRSTSFRFRGTSSSSMIIHESDEEGDATTKDARSSVALPLSSEPELLPPPPPRTRKAKESQYRLGVGRPTAAGGGGARSVTRSTSQSRKGKRGKGSRSIKPTEAAIQEEEEPDPMQDDIPEAGPSGTTHEPPTSEQPAFHPPEGSLPVSDLLAGLTPLPTRPPDTSEQMKSHIANLMAPLQAQVQLLQRSTQLTDLGGLTVQVRSLHAEMESLRSQVALVPQLRSEVKQLKEMVATLTQASAVDHIAPSEKSLGKARASDEESTRTVVGGSDASQGPSTAQVQAFSGMAQQLLGKRHRDLNDSGLADVIEAGQENNYSREDLEKRVIRPTRKRPKLSEEVDAGPGQSSVVQTEAASETQSGEAQPRATFTIFQGPEEPPESYIDPPPPTTHLSDLFPFDAASSQITPPAQNGGGAIPRPPGADENAPNQMPPNFNFAFNASLFHPITSTPFDMDLPPFTYPEPPTSPSPAAPSGGFVQRAGGRIERNDLFQPLRRPSQPSHSPSRPQSAIPRSPNRRTHPVPPESQPHGSVSAEAPVQGGTVNPSALMTPSGLSSIPEVQNEGASDADISMANSSGILTLPRRTVSSTEVGMQLGMSSTLPLPPDTPGAQMKRTMYGTELEGDTRFGDFGVEGVASGFWAGLDRRI